MKILIKALSTLSLFFFLVPTAFTQDEIEQNKYGERFIEAINSTDNQKKEELINEIFAEQTIQESGIERLLAFANQLRKDFGQLNYHSEQLSIFELPNRTSNILHVYAKQPNSVMWKDIQMRLESQSPHKITQLGFIAEVSEPIALPNGNIDQPQTIEWLDTYVKKLNSQFDLYGSILVARKNSIIYENYFGYSDVNKLKPITRETLFNIGSGGKMFTAIAIAQLLEKGLVQYQDTLAKYVSGLHPDILKRVKIHHLLSHTSGISEYWTAATDKAVHEAVSIDDHFDIVKRSSMDFNPGEQYAYSNSNFIVLGKILESITEVSYDKYVKENLFDKASMTTSAFDGSGNSAIPLTRDGDSWVEVKNKFKKASSAGGIYANAEDILRFSRALHNAELTTRENLLKMTDPKTRNIPGAIENYGYGFIINNGEVKHYGHGGTADGVNFEYRYFPDEKITLILFSNQDNGAYDDLKRNTTKLITGER